MKVKKFNEKYEIDYENDITEEIAKAIIVDFIEKDLDGTSLNDSFIEYTRDLYEEDIEDEDEDNTNNRSAMVKDELINYCEKLLKDAKSVKNVAEYEASKYNL